MTDTRFAEPESPPRDGRVSADEVAAALADVRGRPVIVPTDEQRAVIEAPLEPALVVAGAGSGKTETMSARVLWLLANRMVTPGEVLGLTFTRKAAGEFAARLRAGVADLRRAGLLGETDVFDAPVVSTYNAFANALFREHAPLIGRDADAPVIGEAAAWQLARSVVLRSSDARLAALGRRVEDVVEGVLRIARGIAEHDGDPDAVRAIARRGAGLADLPPGSRGELADVARLGETLAALEVLTDLAVEFGEEKRRLGLVEYADQIAFALEVLRRDGRVAAEQRERHRVVLLDEYQDTSVVQSRLLAELFAGHPVMAVGDPNQSIYGWRGASASALEEFASRFGARRRFTLSTSWRNGHRILDAANALVSSAGDARGVPVLRPAPSATREPVDCVFAETVEEEAAAVAEWFAVRLDGGRPPTAALLLRTRGRQAAFLDAFRARGVRFHVLGVGGLLAEPEIADLVCVLRALEDPAAGIELARVLAGSRWRIGPRDIFELHRIARRISRDRGGDDSLVAALDFVAWAPDGHGLLEGLSPAGLERMREAGRVLAALRARASGDLRDLVALVVEEFRIDIEVAANDRRVAGTANLDAFGDALDGYLAIAEHASLGGFLAWLREAEEREDLSPRPEPPEPGTVQVLTVHGAKGLEWDVVAVPRLVEEEFPAASPEGYQGWLGFGRYPWPLRGDAAELPRFDWEGKATRKEVKDERERFSAEVQDWMTAEERRLAYVAVTRARHRLLLTGSFWATHVKPRTPSRFLTELADAGIVPPLPDAPASAVNPHGDAVGRIRWPADPLGSRRAAVEWAAEAVRSARPALAGEWREELELLVAERAMRDPGAASPEPPVRIPASRFRDFVADPAAVAEERRRPMPERPFRQARLGTLFHAWVEERYGSGTGSDLLDAWAGELDGEGDAVGAEELDRLRAIFERSPWADRRPLAVEQEIHLPFDGRIVVCKIDAVYERDGRIEIVDWKTGRAPADPVELERRQLQLALYRLAYARWTGVDPDRIDAVFYFVGEDRIVRPERIDSEQELLARWRSAGYRPPA